MTLIDARIGPADEATSLGGPVYWIDRRLADILRFDGWDQFVTLLPAFERAFMECIIPELERYTHESSLLDALLAPAWATSVLLSLDRDRRGALVALMMTKRDGKDKAVAWGRAEVERIKAEQPFVMTTKYYQEILRALDYLLHQSP